MDNITDKFIQQAYGSTEMLVRVAVLFASADSVYKQLPECDVYDMERDARTYDGPYPVIAHPPCQLWGSLAFANYARWPFEHNKPGNDNGCFAKALAAVRKFGGVLEHPAKTRAWKTYGLEPPIAFSWKSLSDGGWVCEVWQSAYGHRANKATWLYYHGKNPPHKLRWDRPKGTHQIGGYDRRGKAANKPTLGKHEANATPVEFRDELLRLAMTSRESSGNEFMVHNK